MSAKKKILLLSDHPLSTSGVGVQSGILVRGLIETGKYSFRCLGAALKHANYDTVCVNEDFIIKPIDGFGTKEMLRLLLVTEKPDAVMLFTDPRFFIWVWEMEDEIHACAPIIYNHVWDSTPIPKYNLPLYESTDLINCISDVTYNNVTSLLSSRANDGSVNFIPHAVPKSIYFKIPDAERRQARINIVGDSRKDHFIGIWVNRNARRKKPSDVLCSWRIFLDELKQKHGHTNATLILHTDPMDQEGPNLYHVVEELKLVDNVMFSTARLEFDQMRLMYNIADFCINVACAEGFGLPTLEAMQCGVPIIALKTGGLTRQIINHHDGTENGVALTPDVRTLVGSQLVPYIYEDHASNEQAAAAIMKMYEKTPDEKKTLSEKVIAYAHNEFDVDKMINDWDRTLMATIDNWKSRYERIRYDVI